MTVCLLNLDRLCRARSAIAAITLLLLITGPEQVKAQPPVPKGVLGEAEINRQWSRARELSKAGKYLDAARIYEAILPSAEIVWGKEGASTGAILNNLGNAYSNVSDYAKAEPFLVRALKISEAASGSDHPNVALALNNLASLYYQQNEYAKAEATYFRALRIQEIKLGKDHPNVAQTLNNLALVYLQLSDFAKAEPLQLRALEIRQSKLGSDHLDLAHTYHSLGNTYQDMGLYAKAEPMHRRALQIRETKLGTDHPDVAESLNSLALLYRRMGDYAQAETLQLRHLQIVEASFGKDHVHTADSVTNLALGYRKLEQYAKAESFLQRGLKIREEKLGKDHPDVAHSLENLALLYIDMGQFAKAGPLLEKSLGLYTAALGEDHLDLAHFLNILAGYYRQLGQFAKAEELFERSLRIQELKLGKDHPDVAGTVSNLALLYKELGQHAKAERFYECALRISEAKLGEHHPTVGDCLNGLGVLYRAMGRYAKAESAFERSLKIHEKGSGNERGVAYALNNLAVLYFDMGQFPRAETLMKRSLQMQEGKFGKDHPDVAHALNNLAGLYCDTKQLDKVEPLLKRSLEIFEAKYGADHQSLGNPLLNLGNLYSEQEHYAKAETFYLRTIHIREAKLGIDHPDVAHPLTNLASLYLTTGQDAKALANYQRSLEIYRAKLGKDHPRVADSLHNLAWHAAKQKKWTEAVQFIQQARRMVAHHLAEVLPVLSEKEQLALLQANFEKAFHSALSLGRIAPQEAGAASAEWLLNGKAVALQGMAEQQILARDAKDPKAKQLVEDLQMTRARLATLVNITPQPGLEKAYQTQMGELRAKEQDLAQKLARAVGRTYRGNSWVTVDELRAKLGPQAAFVDIARFSIYDFPTDKWKEPRYVAWIVPPAGKGDVQLIDLGDAAAIDKLVEQARKSLIESAKSIAKVGEVEAMEALRKPLAELSAQVLHSLLPSLGKYEQWIVCPDGALWLTPWSALLLPTGEFAVEKHLIRHVVSGRDLVLEQPKEKGESSYLFADPDYDLTPGKVGAASGLRGINSPFLGQRLQGAIGTWNVSFEFLDNEVVIYDEDDKGAVAGKGTWKDQAGVLTIQTGISVFQGSLANGEIRGQRSKRNPDGSIVRDTFRLDAPREESRALGSIFKTLPRVARLPGTALEAEAIRPHLSKWLGQESKLFLEEKANETLLKAVKNPRVLVLATHGYFLPAQEIESKDKARVSLETDDKKIAATHFDAQGQPIENPLLRCGLLLAGCNQRHQAKPGEDDGILTGLEIVGMDLRGCELVVLSACETGLGDVKSGEGVAGLRQSFQLAGSKGVVASLWQVPDRETALLMNTFYSELAKGKSQAEALRTAQIQRLETRKRDFGAAHPFFWAAFTLTNRGG